MAAVADLVLQTANAPGTSTFNLIAPPTGRRSFVSGCGAGAAFYIAHDGTSWEEGVGTVTAGSPDTLSRDTVYRNSLGTTAKIAFTSTVQIYNDVPADRAFWADGSGVYQAQSRRIAALAQATAQTDAARWDQVPWQQIGGVDYVSPGGGASIGVTLPTSGYKKFRLEFENLIPSAGSQLLARVSQDGGSTYKSGSSDYSYFTGTGFSSASSLVTANGTNTAAIIGASGSGGNSGHIEITPTYGSGVGDCLTGSSTAIIRTSSVWTCTALTTRVTTIALVWSTAATFNAGGSVRLLGWAG